MTTGNTGFVYPSQFFLLCSAFGPIIFSRFPLLKDEADTQMPSAWPGFYRVGLLRRALNIFCIKGGPGWTYQMQFKKG
jgi:hypothetical protein